MKSKKFFWVNFIGITLLSLVLTSAVNAEPLRIGFFDFPPHVMTEDGKEIGVAVNYFQLIAKEMGIKEMTFQSLPMNRLMDLLQRGMLDIGLFFAKNEERAAMFIYPEKPYTSIQIALALKKTHPLKDVRTVEDVLPLKLGFVKNGYLPPMLRDERLDIQYLFGKNWTVQNLRKVQSNRLDAAISTYYQLIFDAKRIGILEEFKFLKVPDSEVPIYTAMSESFAQKNRSAYEAALAKIQQETSYSQLFDEFMESYFK